MYRRWSCAGPPPKRVHAMTARPASLSTQSAMHARPSSILLSALPAQRGLSPFSELTACRGAAGSPTYYIIEYAVASSRGKKMYLCKYCIANKRLYVLQASPPQPPNARPDVSLVRKLSGPCQVSRRAYLERRPCSSPRRDKDARLAYRSLLLPQTQAALDDYEANADGIRSQLEDVVSSFHVTTRA